MQVGDLQAGLRRGLDEEFMNDVEHSDLPPGAVVRGRDPLVDRRMSSRLPQELPEGFSRTHGGDNMSMGRNGARLGAQFCFSSSMSPRSFI